MRNPILENVRALRENRPLLPDRGNRNRHLVVAMEEDGSRTAYCFAVPIYTAEGRLLSRQLCRAADGYTAEGSSAEIHISDHFTLRNAFGTCRIRPENGFYARSADDAVLHGTECDIAPTTNGLVFRSQCGQGVWRFRLETEGSAWTPKGNNKYFSLMQDASCPVVTVSCIGSADRSGTLIAPALLESTQEAEDSFLLSVVPQSPYAAFVLFEINLYEQKLFQDTTVESRDADGNNVYGSTAFLGETAAFGEQLLYSRPDFRKIPELTGRQIRRVVLHMNCYNNGAALCASRIERRFCSFGSTWNGRIPETGQFTDAIAGKFRQSIDLSAVAIHPDTGRLLQPEGILIRGKKRGSGFRAVSTGDS